MKKENKSELVYETPWLQAIDLTDGRGATILRGDSGAIDPTVDDDDDKLIEGADEDF